MPIVIEPKKLEEDLITVPLLLSQRPEFLQKHRILLQDAVHSGSIERQEFTGVHIDQLLGNERAIYRAA